MQILWRAGEKGALICCGQALRVTRRGFTEKSLEGRRDIGRGAKWGSIHTLNVKFQAGTTGSSQSARAARQAVGSQATQHHDHFLEINRRLYSQQVQAETMLQLLCNPAAGRVRYPAIPTSSMLLCFSECRVTVGPPSQHALPQPEALRASGSIRMHVATVFI